MTDRKLEKRDWPLVPQFVYRITRIRVFQLSIASSQGQKSSRVNHYMHVQNRLIDYCHFGI